LPSITDLEAALASGDDAAAEAAVAVLAQRGEAAAEVLELLDSRDVERRWWAVRSLAALPAPRTEWFIRALDDEEAEVRAAAALALAAHPHESSATALVSALSDDDNLVAVMAVQALSKIGEAAVPPLLDAFAGAVPRGRIHIMRALAELRDRRSIRLMMDSLEGDSAALQYWAQEGLERLGLNMVYLKPD
jgi:HEAT repeat protein